jgi:flagellar biosynthesis/type III secretory pathway chaperone
MSPPARSPAPAPQAVHPARAVLLELSTLLDAEREALVALDREAIAGFAARKLELDQALKSAVAELKLGAEDEELLTKVRQSALSNQLLLAHARSCVQGVLSLLSPVNTPRYTAPGHSPNAHSAPGAPPVALNLRR